MTLSRADLVAARYALLFTRRTLAARSESAEAFDTALGAIEAALQPASVTGTPKPPPRDDEWTTEWATTAEAATVLDVSDRWARQMAPRIGGVKRGGSWWVPRSSLPEPEEQ